MFSKLLRYFATLLVIGILSCANRNDDAVRHEIAPLRRQGRPASAFGERRAVVPSSEQIAEPTGVVTLRDAAAFALVNNPELRAFYLEIRAAEARKLQAGLLPNPKIGVEVEEFGGTDERRGFDSAETRIELGQLIELAGKRSKRVRVATLEESLAEWDYQSKRLDVMNQVTQALVDVLAAQERLALAEELVEVSNKAYIAVRQRVEAGKDSPVDETKARVASSTVQIELGRARQALIFMRRQLAATWGSRTPGFDKVTGQFYEILPLRSFDELAGLISQNPDVGRWAVEKDKRRAALELEKAEATSDPVLHGGLQYLEEADDTAFILGLSIGVPIFDRNQAGIREATYMLAKAEESHKAVETSLYAALAEAYQRLSSAFTEAALLKSEVLPGAQSAFDAANRGYCEGKFGYLDVLDAQRTLFEVKGRYIEALAAYHKARADVERLIGQSIEVTKDTYKHNHEGQEQ